MLSPKVFDLLMLAPPHCHEYQCLTVTHGLEGGSISWGRMRQAAGGLS